MTMQEQTETLLRKASLEQFPALTRLGVTEQQLQSLSSQGFLGREVRASKSYYKLRFRFAGRQQVRYVRPRDAETVQSELAMLQSQVRQRREFRKLERMCTMQFKTMKAELEPYLASHGFHFHGLAIRRISTAH